MNCIDCTIPMIETTEDVPPPHAAKRICPRCGRFGGWIARPWTVERAAAFVVPIGKHKGRTMAEIAKSDRGWIEWAASNLDKGIARAARTYLDAEPNPTPERTP